MIDELYKKITALVSISAPSESEVDHLMTLVRKMQERKWGDKPSKYPLLHFFVNWTKHATLSQKAASSIVLKMNAILYENRSEKDMAKAKDKITDLLSFNNLRKELGSFFEEYEIPLNLREDEVWWDKFTVQLVHIIRDCPLVLPSKKYSEVDNGIREGVIATDLRLSYVASEIFKDDYLRQQAERTSMTMPAKSLSLVVNLSNNTHLKMMFPIYYDRYIMLD